MKRISLLCVLGICAILATGCSSKTKENETESLPEITDASTQEYDYTLSDVENLNQMVLNMNRERQRNSSLYIL